jgi:hypothetical protein
VPVCFVIIDYENDRWYEKNIPSIATHKLHHRPVVRLRRRMEILFT